MPQRLDDLAHCYNITLFDLLENHAPLKSRKITKRPTVPWFYDNVRLARQLRRKAERKWRQTNKDSDLR